MDNPLSKPGSKSFFQNSFLSLSPRLFAILLICIATVMFSVMDAMAKYLAEVAELPVAQIIWVRLFVHVFFTLIILGPLSLPRLLRSQKPSFQLLRSLFLMGATAFNFAAVKYLQLDQTITIFFLTPLLVAALAGPLLGEWVGWRRFVAICAGFLGVILVTRPGFGGIHWAVIYSIGAAVSFALYNITTRYLASYDKSEITQFYSPLVGAVMFMPLALLSWQWPETYFIWFLLLVMGCIGGLGHWMLIIAHHYAPAPVLAPFIYTGLLSMTVIGYIVFRDIPTHWTLAGALVVIAAGLYLLHREKSKS